MAALRGSGIGCDIYYPLTLPSQECFSDVPGAKLRYPVAERAAETSLALPIFSELTDPEISRVVEAVADAMS